MADLTGWHALPPVQYLIMETLVARFRLGHRTWLFPNRLAPAIMALADTDFIDFRDIGEYLDVWLTPKAKARLSDTYVSPVAATARSLRQEVGVLRRMAVDGMSESLGPLVVDTSWREPVTRPVVSER